MSSLGPAVEAAPSSGVLSAWSPVLSVNAGPAQPGPGFSSSRARAEAACQAPRPQTSVASAMLGRLVRMCRSTLRPFAAGPESENVADARFLWLLLKAARLPEGLFARVGAAAEDEQQVREAG